MDEIEKPDARLEELLEEANVNYAQRAEFRHDPPRAIALLENALSRKRIDKPAAYALSLFRAGKWPKPSRSTRGKLSAYEACARWIAGYGWDESYGTSDVLEEIEAVYSRKGERLRPSERERLLEAWSTELLRRYPPDALEPDEVAEIIRRDLGLEQLELLDA